ncbi:uncharacterized protein LOC123262390 [Cotesia glomerata]|nr:uncharacterized protein LOC123262390 [Cotesia glomerata]
MMTTKRNLNIIHDSERGFTLKNITLADSGKYFCYADGDFENKMVQYQLKVTDNSTFYNPVIINNSPKSLIPGRTLRLRCSVIVPHGHLYLLDWKIPNQNASIAYRYSKAWNDQDSYKLTEDLIVSGVSSKDEGVYECKYIAPQLKKRVSSKINITLDNGIIALDDAVEGFEKMKHKFSSIKLQMKSLFNDYLLHQSRVEKMMDRTLAEFNQLDASLKLLKNDVRFIQSRFSNFRELDNAENKTIHF